MRPLFPENQMNAKDLWIYVRVGGVYSGINLKSGK